MMQPPPARANAQRNRPHIMVGQAKEYVTHNEAVRKLKAI
jgi:hypothetical protein